MKIKIKNFVALVTMLLSIVTMSFILESCQDSKDDVIIVTDDQHGLGELKAETITPISASFEFYANSGIIVYVSSNKETILQVINKIKKEQTPTPYIDFESYSDLFYIISGKDKYYETIYSLSPNTTYYYISILPYPNYSEVTHIKISPIGEFKTDELNLYVSLEGSNVIWCGVNFMLNRGEFESAQFFENYLFSQSSLPNPSEETIEGEWRYPSKEELEELSKICQITLVDYIKMFVRLTDAKGTNLYVPFNNYYPTSASVNGYAFPYKDGNGGLVLKTSKVGTGDKVEGSPYFGNSLKEINQEPMTVKDNFYDWSYSYLGSDEIISGTEKRGVRFVMDK